MNRWPSFERRPRPHPDAEVERILVEIDTHKPKDIMTPFAPEKWGNDAPPTRVDKGDVQSTEEEADEAGPKPEKKERKGRAKPAILFGGKQI